MSRRILQINQLIRQELSQMILREIEFPKEVLVTITRVETSLDLRKAKVYISVMPVLSTGKPNKKHISEVLQILNKNIYNLQQKINKKLQMKTVPKIEFKEEKQINKSLRIEELLKQIKSNNGRPNSTIPTD